MKIMSVNNSLNVLANKKSFRGSTKYFGYDSNHHLKIQDTPSNIGKELYNDFTHELKYLSPKFATVKNAFDLRKGRTGKIYFGDPDEKIDFNQVFKEHDYAVSDMEPLYPDIDKVSAGYFYDNPTKYDEHFKAIADFHDRRETAAKKFEAQYRKNLIDSVNVADSKEKVDYYVWQQKDSFNKRRLALEALEIYNKAKKQKAVKEELGRELTTLYNIKGSTARDIETTEWAINNSKKNLEENNSFVDRLKYKEFLYTELRKMPEDTNNSLYLKWNEKDPIYGNLRLSIFENEHAAIDNFIDKIKEFVNAYQENSKKISAYIQKEINEKGELQSRLKSLAKDIIKKQKEFDDAKAKLIPLFDELKNFYLKHGIK